MHPVSDHTLHELQIITEKGADSILHFFDSTQSFGGRDVLKRMIKNPKRTREEVLSTQEWFKSVSLNLHYWEVNVSHAYIAASEHYFGSNIMHTMSQDVIQHWFQTLVFAYRNEAEFHLIQSGVIATVRVLRALNQTVENLTFTGYPDTFKDDFEFLKSFLNAFTLRSYIRDRDATIPNRSIFYLDYFFRKQHKEELRRVLAILYTLDAVTSIVRTAAEHSLCFPEFAADDSCFEVSGLWHPLITHSTKNNIFLHGSRSVCILTGANTSGKTTFLKSCGVAVYLAHLGWPVPASTLRISFSNRLFSSIHLTDDLILGYSHFYNEIMRVKEVAQALYDGDKCVVLIDELFRGTNQEDALHCSGTVIDGFVKHNDSLFIISTHLMELLGKYSDSKEIQFNCFRTKVVEGEFENTFLLEEGIATEKVGKLIMEKVGIPNLLKGIKLKKPPLS